MRHDITVGQQWRGNFSGKTWHVIEAGEEYLVKVCGDEKKRQLIESFLEYHTFIPTLETVFRFIDNASQDLARILESDDIGPNVQGTLENLDSAIKEALEELRMFEERKSYCMQSPESSQ